MTRRLRSVGREFVESGPVRLVSAADGAGVFRLLRGRGRAGPSGTPYAVWAHG
ncbi:hypothetical protein [Streptomyces sp. NPDC017448]|uniref:hypothetical protein n=1 Tax=Streptomyces sp. NPDC017448 TaxID=3364996 RepID=UPI0037B1BE36